MSDPALDSILATTTVGEFLQAVEVSYNVGLPVDEIAPILGRPDVLAGLLAFTSDAAPRPAPAPAATDPGAAGTGKPPAWIRVLYRARTSAHVLVLGVGWLLWIAAFHLESAPVPRAAQDPKP